MAGDSLKPEKDRVSTRGRKTAPNSKGAQEVRPSSVRRANAESQGGKQYPDAQYVFMNNTFSHGRNEKIHLGTINNTTTNNYIGPAGPAPKYREQLAQRVKTETAPQNEVISDLLDLKKRFSAFTNRYNTGKNDSDPKKAAGAVKSAIRRALEHLESIENIAIAHSDDSSPLTGRALYLHRLLEGLGWQLLGLAKFEKVMMEDENGKKKVESSRKLEAFSEVEDCYNRADKAFVELEDSNDKYVNGKAERKFGFQFPALESKVYIAGVRYFTVEEYCHVGDEESLDKAPAAVGIALADIQSTREKLRKMEQTVPENRMAQWKHIVKEADEHIKLLEELRKEIKEKVDLDDDSEAEDENEDCELSADEEDDAEFSGDDSSSDSEDEE